MDIYGNMDDRHLVESLLEDHKNERAWWSFYCRFASKVVAICRNWRIRDDSRIEDILQDVMFIAYKQIRAKKIRDPERIGWWIAKVTVNEIKKANRETSRSRTEPLATPLEGE